MPEPSVRIRGDLYERSSGHCEVAGEPLTHSFAVHHRKRRSQGGTNDLTNLMIVCHFHHNGGTQSIHAQPALSYRRGWLVHEADEPALVPMQRFIRLYDQHGQYPFFLLTGDGMYVEYQPTKETTHGGS